MDKFSETKEQELFIKGATNYSPEVSLNWETSQLWISGRCNPESAIDFFAPIESAIDRYFQIGENNLLSLTFNLEYINTSSRKSVLNLIKKVEGYSSNECSVIINWCYEENDESIMEIGEDFVDLHNIEMNFVPIPEEIIEYSDRMFALSA